MQRMGLQQVEHPRRYRSGAVFCWSRSQASPGHTWCRTRGVLL